MSPPPKRTKKEVVTAFRTREILAAARRVMERRGVDASTMAEIAQAAGVAKGTIYLYFRSKEDLIQALMSQTGENILRDLESILTSPHNPVEKLDQTVTMIMGYLERERVLFPVYARDTEGWERPGRRGPRPHIWDLEQKFEGLLTRLFAEGIEAGQFIPEDPALLTFLFRGLLRAAGYYQMAAGQKDAVKKALPVLLTLLSSGLARQANSVQEVAAP